MAHQFVSTELDKTVAISSISTSLTKSCGKPTGTIGSEVWETTDPTKILTVDGIIANCPDPSA